MAEMSRSGDVTVALTLARATVQNSHPHAMQWPLPPSARLQNFLAAKHVKRRVVIVHGCPVQRQRRRSKCVVVEKVGFQQRAAGSSAEHKQAACLAGHHASKPARKLAGWLGEPPPSVRPRHGRSSRRGVLRAV